LQHPQAKHSALRRCPEFGGDDLYEHGLEALQSGHRLKSLLAVILWGVRWISQKLILGSPMFSKMEAA
jgi:hypothetical protein